jgi:hypothetical protein
VNSLTFQNAGFWPWLLAAGLPLLLHLLTRRARRAVVLPTFVFVQRALAQQTRLFRVRRWLLLALRTLLVLLLAVTFLKPTLTAPLAPGDGKRRVVLVVLDRSLSMDFRRGGVSSLERAKGQALALLEDLHAGDAANVILAASAPKTVLPKPGDDFGALRQAIKDARALPEQGDMAAAVAVAAEQFHMARASEQELLLASDFQRANWADVHLDALPPDVKLVFLNADDGPRANAAVTGLRLRPATPRAGEEAAVITDVWNGSPTPRTLAVTLTIAKGDGEMGRWGNEGSDQPISSFPHLPISASLTLPPYATGTATFPCTFPDSGRYRIMARILPDDLPADDTRYLVADLSHSLTVLLLTDADTRSVGSGAYFLSRALNPTPAVPGGVRVLPKRPADLSETDLNACDAVLMTEVQTLPADRLPLLARYVKEGGALIVFLAGPQAIPQMEALAQLAPSGEGLPFLPTMPIDIRRRGKGYLILTEARYDSPLLKLFKDPEAGDLGKIRFTRFFLTGEPDPRAEILLRFEDGTPAAARRNLGAGSVLLCNFSPAPSDSDLARQEVFPPLLHEFVKGMTARDSVRREFTPGGPASTTIEAAKASGDVRALGPNGESESVTVDRVSGGVIVERVAQPGFHAILANGEEAALLAVNPPADESDLRPLSPQTLQGQRGVHPAYLVNADAGAASVLERLRKGRPLWPYCLLAAFIALLAEQAVAASGRSTGR